MQVLLVDAPERTEVRAERRARSFTGITMDFALAITVIIACPFVDTVADGGMSWMTPPVALPFVGVQPRAVSWNVFIDEAMARPSVRVVAHPKALLTCIARNDADDGGPIVSIGAVAFALVGTATWRVAGIAMGRAFFPPRSGTIRQPQTPCPSSPRLARYRSGASARAGATYAVACVTSLTHGLSAPWARLSRCRAAAGPAWRGVGGSWQRRCSSGAYNSRHRRGNGKPGNDPAAERVGARGYDSEGRPTPADGGDVPTR
jgi:hypothetical protein